MKKVDTPTLIRLAQAAYDRDYNRQLDLDRLIASVDQGGWHLLVDVLLHEHAGGVLVDPHVRCQVYIKIATSGQPVVAWLDVELGMFNALSEAKVPVGD